MSLIEALIPGVLGLLLALRPDAVFIGSKVEADPGKLRLLRGLGAVLLVVSCVFVVIALIG